MKLPRARLTEVKVSYVNTYKQSSPADRNGKARIAHMQPAMKCCYWCQMTTWCFTAQYGKLARSQSSISMYIRAVKQLNWVSQLALPS